MALLGSNLHKTWVFEQCHVALFVEIAILLYFKLLKQTSSETRFLWFELCHFPLNCAMWHCSQSLINTGFFANSAKFSSQAVGVPEIGFYPPTARTCANLLMSTSGASCHGRDLTAEALRRELPGVQPPRTRVSLLMSTSEASCPGRELSRAATHRELRAQALGLKCGALS